ncbi:MAG: hypothetical protein ACUVXJ_16530 [Phycisphaerae bacterium]
MSDNKQENDTTPVSTAEMSPEAIEAALAAAVAEVSGQSDATGQADSPLVGKAGLSADQPTDQTPAEHPHPVDAPAGAGSTIADQASVRDLSDPSMPAETEATLDRIDSDLAELESLLAEMSSDGTSIPASIAQAAPPPAEAQGAQETVTKADKPAEPEPTAKTEAAPVEKAEENAPSKASVKDESGDIYAMLLYVVEVSAPEVSEATETTSKEVGNPVAEVAEETAEVATEPVRGGPLRSFGQVIAKVLVNVLVILDKPVDSLGPSCRTAVGLAAIATFLVAVVTWFIGSAK